MTAVPFHLRGYPGDLKFPGRQLLGNENGGTPALLLPEDKGKRREGEQPSRWSLGGEGGSRYFSSKKPGWIEYFQFCDQHLIWLLGHFVQ